MEDFFALIGTEKRGSDSNENTEQILKKKLTGTVLCNM